MKELINNLTLIRLLILSFGAYSITRLFVTDDLFAKQRDWLFHRFPPEGYQPTKQPKRGKATRAGATWYVTEGTFIGKLLSCPWCWGFWVSLGITIGYWFAPYVTMVLLLPFALRVAVGWIAVKVGG